jgi:hypothetical protein
MMRKIIALSSLIFLFSCYQNEEKPIENELLKKQIQTWKKQLVLNGEIGKPCQKNIKKWTTDSIKSKLFYSNKDKINDVLLYFPAGDCCSCSVGMNEASDFLKLIYSNGNEFIENTNLREKIALKIENEFYQKTNTDVERAIFFVTDFNSNIEGEYKLWTLEDPDCCASVEGTFKYNPFTYKIEITHLIVK